MARQSFLILFISVFTFFTYPFQQVNANHKAGSGNITWKCIGKDRFEVSLSLYIECINNVGTPSASLNVGCKSSGSIGNITKKQIGSATSTEITPTCESNCTTCGNSSCSNNYGWKKYKYTYIVDLSNTSCCKVRFSYSGVRSSGSGIISCNQTYVSSWFDYCQAKCDNSPQFNSVPQNVVCKNQGFNKNLRAYDVDTNSSGNLIDSIAYELRKPKKSQNSNCTYQNPYSYNKPLQFKGFPNANFPYPSGFNLDPQSGQLKFTPTRQQITLISYKVKEYRDTNNNDTKELIGVVTREENIRVKNCSPNNNPSITGMQCNSSSKSKTICAGQKQTFTFCSSDPDTGDSVRLKFNQGELPDSANWSIVNKNAKTQKGKLTWQTTKNDIRDKPYEFTVNAKDDNCPLYGQVTKPYKINVNPIPEANYRFDSIDCGKYQFKADVTKGDNVTVSWNGESGIQSNKDTFTHQFQKPGKYAFTLTLKGGGCSRKYEDTVMVNRFLHVNAGTDTTICKGTNFKVGKTANGNQGSVNYLWHDGVTGQATRTFQNLQKDTFMTLQVSDQQCKFKDSLSVNVKKQLSLDLGADTQQVCDTDSLLLKVKKGYSRYTWSTGDSGNSTYVKQEGLVSLLANDTLGCTRTDTTYIRTLKADIVKQRDTACTRFTWAVTGQTYQQSGTYYGSRQNSNFCDSSATIALELTINKKQDTTIAREACGQYTVPSQDETYQQSGTYRDTLSTISGCDSVITINLTINQPDFKADTVKTCKAYTWPVNGQTYQQSGTYTDTFTNQAGCDSIRQLALTINPTKQNTLKPVACKSYTVPSQDETYTSSGTYYDTLSSTKSCDSILTIQLTVPDTDTAIERNGQTLSVSDSNADSFQWLNCEGGLTPIKGATNSSFQPDSNGRYAVLVSEEGCTDTSFCYAIETIGFQDNDFGKSLKVYPNPANDRVTVKFNQSHQVIKAELISSSGQTLSSKTYRGTKQFEVPLPETQGYYILNLTSSKGRSAQIKLLKN